MNESKENFVKYSVGKRFPLEQYLTGKEMNLSMITSNFFNVFISLKNITQRELFAFRESSLTVSLFEMESIPYIIFDFGGWRFDVSIDSHRISNLTKWLTKKSNLVNMFLVDADSGILKAMRQIGLAIEMTENIRDICEKQIFIEANVVEKCHQKIYAEYSIIDMIKHAQLKQTFWRPSFGEFNIYL